jgi:hypothetical protein
MITKSDWQAVHARMLAERRQGHGDPPTVEEMLAFANGELSKEDEERVRTALVAYPELLRAVHADFDDESGEDVPEIMVERQLRALRAGLPPATGDRRVQFWRTAAAIAAVLALTFGALLWRAQSQIGEPRLSAWQTLYLEPDGGLRGGPVEAKTFSSTADLFLLNIALLDERHFDGYRIDLVAANAKKPVWTGNTARPDDDTFTVVVPRKSLPPGSYEAVVYGIDGTATRQIARYAFRVR